MKISHVPRAQRVTATALVVASLFLFGCASTIRYSEWNDKGTKVLEIEASDYTLKSKQVTGAPSRWFNANSLTGLVSAFFTNLAPLVTRPDPIIVPVPTPAPTPTPAPVEPPCPVVPTPTPVPPVEPVTPPAPTPVTNTVFTVSGNLITLDLENVPEAMHNIGIPGGANELYYSLAHIYAYGPARPMVSELEAQNPYRQQIFDWFDNEVLSIIALMKSKPTMQLIAISNDGKDRCGFRLGPAIVERVLNDPAISASRVQVGQTLSPDDY